MPARTEAAFDPKAFLEKVSPGKSILNIPKGRNVFSQGDAADTVFYLQTGKVKLVVVNDEGKEAVVGLIDAGQFFGEGCLKGQTRYIGTATALEDCVITAIAKGAMIAALHDHQQLSEMFMAFLLLRNGRIEADLIDQLPVSGHPGGTVEAELDRRLRIHRINVLIY